MKRPKKILGIDPGTGICGFGVISAGAKMQMLDAGVIRTAPNSPLPERLLEIYSSIKDIIELNQPDLVSIEKLFFTKNITTGIAVAEARGVCLLAIREAGLPIFEYTPNEIKKMMTGYGGAEKKQMQEMVKRQLNLKCIPKPDDAADALAAAIVCALATKLA